VKKVLFSILAVCLLWLVFSWPLARYFDAAIPSSSADIEKGGPRRMIQGDHLQLLYYYWLNADMLIGKTPFFYNVYEYNTGDDETRKYVGFDEYPWVLVFLPAYLIGGRAVGWNVMCLASIWATFIFTWLWISLHGKRGQTAFWMSLTAISLPFLWAMLMGGSPAGVAMAWVPMMLYGIELLLRKGSIWGGVWAALGVLFSVLNDGHVAFFGLLAGVGWGAVILLTSAGFPWRTRRDWLVRIRACIPLFLLGVVVILMVLSKKQDIAESAVSHGRSWSEVALYSPRPQGLVSWTASGHDATIFIGWTLIAVLAAGLVAFIPLLVRERTKVLRDALVYACLLSALGLMVALALGVRGPLQGRVMFIARKVIPSYEFIRQPAKIFVVLPPFLALACWYAVTSIARAFSLGNRGSNWLAAGLALAIVAEQSAQVNGTFCILDREQAAYAAVAEDARGRGKEPHVVVLPIWPGDSSWASLYELYVSLYRIRMLNGYLPVVPATYVDDVYWSLDPSNTGLLGDKQLSLLREMGIEYVLLHEDAYPEKLSCFPVSMAIKRLMNHPELDLLSHSESVWAFRILEEPRQREPVLDRWDLFLPTIVMHAEYEENRGGEVIPHGSDCPGAFVRLADEGDGFTTRVIEHIRPENGKLGISFRGEGEASMLISYDDGRIQSRRDLVVDGDAWEWQFIALTNQQDTWKMVISVDRESGTVDVNQLLYAAGNVEDVYSGARRSVPAALFFHAGYTDLETDGVILEPDREAADYIVYGPRLPLAPGRYEMELLVDTEAPAGTDLGHFVVDNGAERSRPFPVTAGARPTGSFYTSDCGMPVTVYYSYSRAAPVTVRGCEWVRTGDRSADGEPQPE